MKLHGNSNKLYIEMKIDQIHWRFIKHRFARTFKSKWFCMYVRDKQAECRLH